MTAASEVLLGVEIAHKFLDALCVRRAELTPDRWLCTSRALVVHLGERLIEDRADDTQERA